jgi:nitroreductase
MDMIEVIKTRRTVRLFKQDTISISTLRELVDCGRCAPSGANRQPLEYVIVNDMSVGDRLFDSLAWAGYVQPRRNPPVGKRPVAYIVVLVNRDISRNGAVDAAAAIENILLAGWSKGIGSCWMGAIDRDAIGKLLGIPENFAIDSVVSLGVPDEEPVMEDCKGDSVEYYLDENDRLHVPKRKIDDIMHHDSF